MVRVQVELLYDLALVVDSFLKLKLSQEFGLVGKHDRSILLNLQKF
jgi:hypothetical protein